MAERRLHLLATAFGRILPILLLLFSTAPPARGQGTKRMTLVVVPPLINRGSPEYSWLGIGMADRVRDVLRLISEIDVVSDRERQYALRLLSMDDEDINTELSSVNAGRILGADVILAGTYTVRGATVHLERRMIDARSGEVISVTTLAGTLPTLFDLIDKYALSGFIERTATSSDLPLPPVAATTYERQAISMAHRPKWASFELYCRGRAVADKRPIQALQLFMKAIQHDGFHARAYEQAARLTFYALNQPAEALEYIKTALNLYEQEFGVASVPAAEITLQLGVMTSVQGDYSSALAFFEQSRQRRDKMNRQGSFNYLVLLSRIADAHRLRNDFDKALDHYLKAKEIAEQVGLASTEPYAGLMASIGGILYVHQRYGKAEQALQKSLWIRTDNKILGSREGVSLLNSYANVYRQQNNPAKGIEYAEQGLELCRASSLKGTVECAALMTTTGILHYLQQEYKKAVEHQSAGRALYERVGQDRSAAYAAALYHLGGSYIKTGDPAEAGRCFQRASEIFHSLGMVEQGGIVKPLADHYGRPPK